MAQSKRTRRPKGSGSETKLANGRWQAQKELTPNPVTGKRRRIRAQGATRSEARRNLEAKLERLAAEGTIPSTKAPQLHAYMDHWLKLISARVKPRVLETYRSECNTIATSIGGMRLDAITPASIENMCIELSVGRSSKSVYNYWTRLKQILHYATREGLISTNPALATEPPRTEPADTEILSTGQPAQAIETMKSMADNRLTRDDDERAMWALMFTLAFSTGMRQAERFGLTPSELVTVDGTHGIQIEHTLQRLNGNPTLPAWLKATRIDTHHWLLPPKSHKSIRFVPLDTETWLALQTRVHTHHIKPHELIFTTPDHRPLSEGMERRRWKKTLEQAGLPYVTMRSARHFFSTALAQTGAADDARRTMMGHAKISTTAGYTHWSAESLAALANEARGAIFN
ncbi:tyrosine-type recombinase/integrase [Bifidobacterium animalis]|uniref:Site-specific recombinase, phage integrase family n=1 Tax=Bifidobacterium animalis subsp. lactis TaxID=302911 RepID=A0A8B3RK72_BIFAN|nr:site-specific integrase [Bifidobacterium animalis]RYM96093.1 Site-specific recombinase, phage integrase family [Bifidobacterium animalis subsp. lactis]